MYINEHIHSTKYNCRCHKVLLKAFCGRRRLLLLQTTNVFLKLSIVNPLIDIIAELEIMILCYNDTVFTPNRKVCKLNGVVGKKELLLPVVLQM